MSKKKLLIVDDSPSIRQLVKLALRNEDFDIFEGGDGNEALEMAKLVQVDLIITDLHMPNKNGLEFAREVRAIESYKNTPIFMMTTEYAKTVALEGKKIGVTAWLVKPVKPEALLSVVKAVLNKESSS